jgi:drug/metabolite transporter (DMT)-like permease
VSPLSRVRTALDQRDDVPLLTAIIAVCFWSATPLFVRGVSTSTTTVIFWRFMVATPVMIFVAYLAGGRLTKELFFKSFWPGVLFAGSLVTGLTALRETSIANATLIMSLQPVLVLMIAPKLFKEKVRLTQIVSSAVAMVGVTFFILAAASTSGATIRGDLIAFSNLFVWTGYFLLSKHVRSTGAGEHSWSFLAIVFVWSSLFVAPWALITSDDIGGMTTKDWILVVSMVLLPGVLGHGMMTWAQRHVDVTVLSLLMLLQPVLGAFGAWVVYDQHLNGVQIFGGVLVLGALAAIVRESRAVATAEAQAAAEVLETP